MWALIFSKPVPLLLTWLFHKGVPHIRPQSVAFTSLSGARGRLSPASLQEGKGKPVETAAGCEQQVDCNISAATWRFSEAAKLRQRRWWAWKQGLGLAVGCLYLALCLFYVWAFVLSDALGGDRQAILDFVVTETLDAAHEVSTDLNGDI